MPVGRRWRPSRETAWSSSRPRRVRCGDGTPLIAPQTEGEPEGLEMPSPVGLEPQATHRRATGHQRIPLGCQPDEDAGDGSRISPAHPPVAQPDAVRDGRQRDRRLPSSRHRSERRRRRHRDPVAGIAVSTRKAEHGHGAFVPIEKLGIVLTLANVRRSHAGHRQFALRAAIRVASAPPLGVPVSSVQVGSLSLPLAMPVGTAFLVSGGGSRRLFSHSRPVRALSLRQLLGDRPANRVSRGLCTPLRNPFAHSPGGPRVPRCGTPWPASLACRGPRG